MRQRYRIVMVGRVWVLQDISLSSGLYARRWIKQFAWLLAVIQSLLIVASRKHYMVDVVVAWYTAFLVVFFVDKKLTELPDRTTGTSTMPLPFSAKDIKDKEEHSIAKL